MTEQEIKEYIQGIYHPIINLINFRFDEDLTEYELVFSETNRNTLATCCIADKEIKFYPSKFLHMSMEDIKRNVLECLIHELTHAIDGRYKLSHHSLCDFHNMAFAITCYCLQRELIGKRHSFYRAYDFADEEGIEGVVVDEVQLNKAIRSIRFGSVEELCEAAKKYADYYRKEVLHTLTYEELEAKWRE